MGTSRILAVITGKGAAVLALVAAAALWLATADFALIDRLQQGSDEQQPVSTGRDLAQTFTTPGENISRVDLVIAGAPGGDAGELVMQVVTADTPLAGDGFAGSEVLAVASLDAGSLDYSAIRRLEVGPVSVVPGEPYAFTLSSAAADDEPVEMGANPRDEYPGGSLYIDGVPAEGDLYFALFHGDGSGGMLERMEPWRPFPLSSSGLIVALLLVGAGAFGWLLREIAAGQDPGESDV